MLANRALEAALGTSAPLASLGPTEERPLDLPMSPCFFLYLLISPYISLYLLISPYISLYLLMSPCISVYLPMPDGGDQNGP